MARLGHLDGYPASQKRALFGFLQPTDRIKMHNGDHTFFFTTAAEHRQAIT